MCVCVCVFGVSYSDASTYFCHSYLNSSTSTRKSVSVLLRAFLFVVCDVIGRDILCDLSVERDRGQL